MQYTASKPGPVNCRLWSESNEVKIHVPSATKINKSNDDYVVKYIINNSSSNNNKLSNFKSHTEHWITF